MKTIKEIEFINKFNIIHNYKYDYKKFIYINSKEKVTIICPIHGEFEQTIYNHSKGWGRKKCGRNMAKEKTNYTSEKFIELAKEIHGNKYNYLETIYKNSKEKLKIICDKHGEFYQVPTNHLKGKGCPKCKGEKMSKDRRMSLELFIEKSNNIHNNLYDYSLSKAFKNNLEKIKIICKEHGVFEQTVSRHLMGSGCTNCGYSYNNYKKTDWIIKANNKKGIFYIIKCCNENETFYKLGITFNSVKQRYNHKISMPYNYKIIKEVISENLSYIWDLEKRFKRIKIKHHYTPLIKFGGSKYECFKN